MSLKPTTAEIASMRTDLEAVALPDTCNILSVTQTADGQGGFTDAWGTASASVACRLDQKTGMEAQAGGAIQPFSSWVLSVPQATTLTTDHRVEHGGQTYNVISVDDDGSWQVVKRAQLERVAI